MRLHLVPNTRKCQLLDRLWEYRETGWFLMAKPQRALWKRLLRMMLKMILKYTNAMLLH